MAEFTGQWVLITGGAGGMGRAMARRFVAAGARVVLWDQDPLRIEAATAELGGPARAVGMSVDITDHGAVAAAARQVEADVGPVHALVNNAGWDVARPFLDTDPGLWQQLIAVNLVGHLNVHHAVLPAMVARRAGAVVNIASDAARVGSSGEAVYAACKGGLVAFTKTIARELAAVRIPANVVCPGPTDTALFRDFAGQGERGDKLRAALARAIPFGRLGEADDVAGAVVFLASPAAAFITGQVLSVSGGLTMNG